MGFFFVFLFFAMFAMYSVVGVAVILIITIVFIATFLLVYAVCSIFYYLIGKEAGFDQPWVAFLPGGKNYIAFTIPHREFNMGFFSTPNRKLMFWIWFAADAVLCILGAIGFLYIIVEMESINKYFSSLTYAILPEHILPFIMMGLILYFLLVYFAVRTLFHWRKNYDLLKTYNYNKTAVIVPLLNIICPLVMMVFPIFLAGRLPEYGADGYYPLENYN